MQLCHEQVTVIAFAAKNPGTHMLVHGRAGVGKSYVRDKIIEVCQGTTSIVLGPTGMSINRKMPTPFVYTCARFLRATPESIRDCTNLAAHELAVPPNVLRRGQIIFEEAGMISPVEFCAMDKALQASLGVRKPFGGLRVILFCDVLQLRPVDGTYFFETTAFRSLYTQFVAFELETVHRRTYEDEEAHEEFQSFLSELREARVHCGSRADGLLKYFFPLRSNPPENALRLFCTNEKVDNYNTERLEAVSGNTIVLLPAKSKPQFFKIGVPVQITRNVYASAANLLAVNGTLGILESVSNAGHDITQEHPIRASTAISACIDTEHGPIILNATAAHGLPISLAFATTVHRVQGQTLDTVVFDGQQMFDSQHMYTAASRVKSLHAFYCTNIDTELLYTQTLQPNVTAFLLEHGIKNL